MATRILARFNTLVNSLIISSSLNGDWAIKDVDNIITAAVDISGVMPDLWHIDKS